MSLAAVLGNVKADALAFVQCRKSRPLDVTDMDEHVRPAAVGLNEAEALCSLRLRASYMLSAMKDCCDDCQPLDTHRANPTYRCVLWAVLAINAVMFAVEIGAGLAAGSASLQADALDFLGDAANYATSLFVVGMALRYPLTDERG
jgi:hypothetical protein